ncbi:MAG: HlyD family efflux transporter periplasmic adaptor subunit [Synechococcales cyanobacterium M58_A2018_015]|nr:HlyD family efflux transporter periplasmic adaptor subunit [Synechococcales cyanobacterium M58_A2018_015]
MNGQNGNGNSAPGNGAKRTPKTNTVALETKSAARQPKSEKSENQLVRTDVFDQPVILEQPKYWSRAIVWGIVGVATFAVAWAAIAKIEEAVPATGQLEPQSQVQPIQAPVGGVVEEIYVRDGQQVKQGDLLVRLDPTAALAEQQSLEQVRTSLERQNRFYRSQLAGSAAPSALEAQQLNLPPEILSLTANRAALIEENQLYQAQLSGSADLASLSPTQRIRIQAGLSESNSRAEAARLEISQLQQQLDQTKAQLASAQQSLAIDERIYNDLRPLLEDGGISRVQVVRQEQQVIEARGEVDRLTKEQERLQYAIVQAQEKFANTVALSQTDLLNKIAENDKQIATIDSQLNKAILDNENQIADINSRLSQAQLTLRYQELRAPVDGIVFDLKAKGRGYVANTTEPILKVVPGNALVAEVYITNQDIGFVNEGMPVDVRVDSFPFSEFGDIKGTITNIGSDALPPDQIYPYYRFPAEVELDRQFIAVNGKEIPLQSGMSVTANIITRKRSVLSIFTDLFSRKIDSLRTVR